MERATTIEERLEWDKALNASARAWDQKIERLGQEAWLHPQVVAERAEHIYARRYKATFERLHHGKFVAIDIDTEQAHIGETPKQAWLEGLKHSLTARLFLVRVGFPVAFEFKVGRYRYAYGNRVS